MTVFLFLLCAIAAILLMGGYYTYRIAFYSPKKGRDKISTFASHKYDPYRKEINRLFCQLSDRPYEEVSIVSFDGLTLFGRYYHVKDGAPLDIGFHGYRSSALTDFAGGSELSFSMGHNLLLIDERAHGRSEGRTITFGIQERWDAENWARFAVERFGADVQIILYGVSMGAATVLMAAGLDLPENVKGIIADCPYSSPGDIIRKVARDMHMPDRLAWPFVKIGGRVYGGFDALLSFIRKVFRGKKGGQLGMGLLVGAMDIATANNTVAIVMANPIAKEMSEDYGISPSRTACLLDTFSCIFQGIIPYGAQMLVAISAAAEMGFALSAFSIMRYLFYPYLLLVSSLVAIFLVKGKKN